MNALSKKSNHPSIFTESLASRRTALKTLGLGALGLGTLAGCAATNTKAAAKVVVVGGGYGGATAAKYIRMWSDYQIEVTLVEPDAQFISCPLSNLVIGGSKGMGDISVAYDNLQKRHGVKIVRAWAQGIDATQRTVRLNNGEVLNYDRLVLSPGVDMMWEAMPGLQSVEAQARVLHAWKAGAQTLALRKQLEAMPNGGVFAIAIPTAPYRCPPGPYERACQVAHYFKAAKPKSKVLILDGNDDVTSKGALFKKAWAERYAGIIEYRPKHVAIDVDAQTLTAKFEVQDDVRADVLNVLPPMRAGAIAVQSGLATANKRWCEVNFLSYESIAAPKIHVLGDAIQVAPLMPKSGHMANQHAKVCAAAIVALLNDQAPNPNPLLTNTCYSFVSDKEVVHVASVHRYDAEKKTMLTVAGAGGLSAQANELEGHYAFSWATNIWADSLA